MTDTSSDISELLSSLPIDQLATQLGEDPAAVKAAAEAALPALLGGLHANALAGGEGSLLEALDQHTGAVDPSSIDVADGAQAVSHIFGPNQDKVIAQLGTTGVSGGLIQKLLPLLAPLVLAWLAKQVGGGGAPSQAGGGVLGTILEQVLKGVGQGAGSPSSSGGLGTILGDVLGGLLGAGRK